MSQDPGFPRELKFLRFIFGLGACTGLFLLIIGALALFVGSMLSIFGEDPGSLAWTLNFLAYGVLGTMVSIRVFQLLHTPDLSSPRLIVVWVWWLMLGELVLRLVSYLTTGTLENLLFTQVQSLTTCLFFYLIVSSQFRYRKAARVYYGALAPPSHLAWMTRLEKWFLQAWKFEGHREDVAGKTKDHSISRGGISS